jgi:hypothetical protein
LPETDAANLELTEITANAAAAAAARMAANREFGRPLTFQN